MDNVDETLICQRIFELIQSIYKLHSDFSTEFSLQKELEHCNLKKKQIRHVTVVEEAGLFTITKSFYKLLSSYSDHLKKLIVEIDLEVDFTDLDLRIREKMPDSVVNKLKYYRVGKREVGQIDLIKCLNDLLGFRITLDLFDHNSEAYKDLCDKVNEIYAKRIAIRDSSKAEYRAIHIYFYGESNRYFPWELQIWRSDQAHTNDKSHKVHKQAYTKWAEIYKNSSELSELN
ncbi:hypothetical protein AB1K32_19530 [Metabacillus dongyingensis]|uniref:hypothetical protein n=1 Tax=Metabacillus dongyingensis TaxID=2874282 RepID=UPI003B8CFB22